MRENAGFIGYKGISASVLRSMDFALIVAGYVLASGLTAVLNSGVSSWNLPHRNGRGCGWPGGHQTDIVERSQRL
jgi:hypothetical protein